MVFLTRILFEKARQKPNLRNVKRINYKLLAVAVIGFVAAICPIYIFPLYNVKSYRKYRIM